MSSLALVVGFVLLVGAFFKTQVIQNKQYVMQSEENRLRPIPLPAPRGIIYDRHGEVIAENLPAYSVSITAPSDDTLRGALAQLARDAAARPERRSTTRSAATGARRRDRRWFFPMRRSTSCRCSRSIVSISRA